MAIIVSLFLYACDSDMQSHTGSSAFNRDNVLRYDVQAPFGTLAPFNTGASGSMHVFPFLYSYLFIPDEEGNLKPDLAIRWDFNPERLAWTIELREDARFHDGKPVTARDIKYSVDSVVKKSVQLRDSIAGVFCMSGTKVRIDLKKKDPLFLQSLWRVDICPAHGGSAVDYYNRPIGSGPFVFQSRQDDEQVILKANDDYYAGRPSLDGIVFSYQPDREKTWTRLLRGETDIATEISPLNYKMTKQVEDLFYFDQRILGYCSVLLYNTHDPLFSDPRVRMALTHAIDRQFIVEEILKGFGTVAKGPLGVRSEFCDPEARPVVYDPEKALNLLNSAGWSHAQDGRLVFSDDRPFTFTLLIFKESQVEKTVARYIQLCLDEIGIRMRVKTVPFHELLNAYYRGAAFQAVLTEFATGEGDLTLLRNVWLPPISSCSMVGFFHDPECTRLLTEALQARQPERRRFLVQAFDARIVSLQPCTFLFQKLAINVMSKRFRLSDPFSMNYRGICCLKNASLEAR